MPFFIHAISSVKSSPRNIMAEYSLSTELWQGQTDNIPTYQIGSTIGTHIGPGAIDVAFFEKDCND